MSNLKLYKKSYQRDLEKIENILDHLGLNKKRFSPEYKKLLKTSSDFLANKWKNKTKYCRTEFAQQAFQENYPDKYLELSLMLDAIVNILDELYDEDLDKQEKELYILEFLRATANYSYLWPNKKFGQKVQEYFNKLIVLAVAEKRYQEMLKKKSKTDDLAEGSAQLLLCRGMDMDIFTEIALLDKKEGGNKEKIKDTARIFRALNILKKDILDLEHDRKNNIDTVLLLVVDKNIELENYFKKIFGKLGVEKVFPSKTKGNNVNASFLKMIEKEKRQILKISKSIKD
jgi:hypothetical protein